MHTCQPTGITASEFRRVLGRFASGVTIVTGVDGGQPVGFACQSFAAVSLDPPLVLFCADRAGTSWPRIRAAGRFCVNILAEHQREVCDRFGSRHGARFTDLPWDASRWGTPALRDVLARVHAEIQDVHVAGDHDVVIGRVLELESAGEHSPMIFFRGGFSLDPVGDAWDTLGRGWGWG
ncbi:flavin reductase family protein [Jatrophihabitans cynanchi]|jgi:flavin reductase (DIM6/NTAB) family NADH-FMN oxidoreductase RutF|uniref:Flavin reductase family protein n=1 Tax=Jatrophihabitans cynanchi TaxID=2944128 RepID=A0ABY7JUY2_9ACTN|nr:flavin reductase family protein [Jatrophihabitans sp. SB3-54]WAX56351.1 flavin reductase family protein [Jatrophihabitans sp. SB3-54]